MKSARDFSYVTAAKPVADDAFERRSKVQLCVQERKFITVDLTRIVGHTLQPHRGLALEGSLPSKSQKSRRSVKEPAHGAGVEGAHVLVYQSRGIEKFCAKGKRCRGEIVRVAQLVKVTGSRLKGIRRGGISSGQ